MDKELAIKDSDRHCLNLHRKWTFAALISLPKSYTMGSVCLHPQNPTHSQAQTATFYLLSNHWNRQANICLCVEIHTINY